MMETTEHGVMPDIGGRTHCPTCGRRVHLYPRSIISRMARNLIKLHLAGPGYHHLPTLTGDKDGITAKLRYWDLIESRGDEREDGNPWSGWWRITERGTEFALGRIEVVKYMHTYNTRVLYSDGPLVDIHYCLRNRFNYDEMMRGVFRDDDEVDDDEERGG